MVDLSDRRRSGLRLVGIAQHQETIVETPGDLLDGQRPGPRRGELDGQRQSVERAAQVQHAGVVQASRCRLRRWAVARRVNSSTASERARGASSKTTSPSMSSGTWLVHRIRSPGASSRRRTAREAAASTTCSQLSRMTRAEDVLSRSKRAASPPGPSTAPIKASTTSSAVTAVSSLANQTPSRPTRPARGRQRSRPPSSRCLPVPRSPRAARWRAGRRGPPPPSHDRRARQSSPAGSRPASGAAPSTWREARSSDGVLDAGSVARAPAAKVAGRDRARRPAGCFTRWYVARASAWRPARYSAVMSSSHRLSWNGYVATAASSSPITSATSPSRNRAVNWISSSCVRASSSRARCG